ncbi:MAG: type II toxin-antitoxin system PemK/MazF family toxin [Flavobacterium sp.]|uniref:type II toxin-antitoxin system PemK/MazF family toxin n=1 Tax=Flavobacterium sp. TaxID=239 RepID=UPI00260691ED|nr:type II toxin-antitoxin system PemK/MazF family toxin [Flavobacterium sp.]MDD5150973.1 type II toxin-antitoxin system PemK/MazF family toxin [Flavobacterium sp.]
MVRQYEIYWVVLDPTLGSEINKIRPCLVISPNESNQFLNTVLIAPITSKIRNFPMRLGIVLENKKGQICFDQIRCIDKIRLKTKIDTLAKTDIENVKKLLKEYLVN